MHTVGKIDGAKDHSGRTTAAARVRHDFEEGQRERRGGVDDANARRVSATAESAGTLPRKRLFPVLALKHPEDPQLTKDSMLDATDNLLHLASPDFGFE